MAFLGKFFGIIASDSPGSPGPNLGTPPEGCSVASKALQGRNSRKPHVHTNLLVVANMEKKKTSDDTIAVNNKADGDGGKNSTPSGSSVSGKPRGKQQNTVSTLANS